MHLKEMVRYVHTTHPNSDDNAAFGRSVAISEDFIIVGAPFGDYNDVDGGVGQGYIEVFQITPYGIKKYTAGNAFETDGTIRPQHTTPIPTIMPCLVGVLLLVKILLLLGRRMVIIMMWKLVWVRVTLKYFR